MSPIQRAKNWLTTQDKGPSSGLGRTALFSGFYWALAILTLITSAKIALDTPFNVHPDEFAHADVFCYFARHWWPPDLNSPDVVYGPQGWNRVYAGEIVYLVYGSIARVIQPVLDFITETGLQPGWPKPWDSGRYVSRAFLPLISRATGCRSGFEVYRLFNVMLYAITLGVLYHVGRKQTWFAVIGLLLMSIPQVTYVYSYANSDAWALSWSLFLFVFALNRRRSFIGSWGNLVGLGVLTGLVLLAKKPFWALLLFVYVPLGWSLVTEMRERDDLRLRDIASSLAILLATCLFVIAPMKIVYPLSQGDYGAGVAQMREARAMEGWKPSNPTRPGYRLASRGVPFREMLTDLPWLIRSAESFYGLFGYMTLRSPQWVYGCAAIIALLCSLCTIGFVIRYPNKVPGITKVLLILIPPTVALSVLASMHNSWIQWIQAQGRYLFPLLIPLALLMGGTIDFEPRWLRTGRLLCMLILFLLSMYVLWFVVLQDTGLLF